MENFQKLRPENKQEALALEIAENLCDLKNLGLYLAYCRKYPAEIIHQAYGLAKEIPANKIKKNRGAFFTYLVKYYVQNQKTT